MANDLQIKSVYCRTHFRQFERLANDSEIRYVIIASEKKNIPKMLNNGSACQCKKRIKNKNSEELMEH